MRTVRCLSIHSDYACRNSGACCTAGWRIPVDDESRRALESARDSGRLAFAGALLPVLDTSPCRFFAPDTHLCAIHRDLGAAHKPSSCRHFPRVALLDARGVSLTLSHFCPTAASLLFRDDVSLAIVTTSTAFPPDETYEGLDARNVMPPLLRPGMLWDLDGYSAWEERAVAFLGVTRLVPEAALKHLRAVAGRIEAWTPGAGSLRAHVVESFERLGDPTTTSQDERLHTWGKGVRVVNRYLAARLFASWVPYQTDRLTALVDDLGRTLALLEEQAARSELFEAIRATDLHVVHGEEPRESDRVRAP